MQRISRENISRTGGVDMTVTDEQNGVGPRRRERGLSEPHEPSSVEDESHYITTHEIQLTETRPLTWTTTHHGRGDCEDDNLVYPFVDYARVESDETQGGQRRHGDKNRRC
ncbi:unnamed protein product [Boreogadus saida]